MDVYALETLMADLVGHDRRPSAYLVWLALWAEGQGDRVAMSHAALARRTGLSRRGVQDAVAHLQRRALIAVEREAPATVPRYSPLAPWRRGRKD
jgi:CRP-like cAMP-binding protein